MSVEDYQVHREGLADAAEPDTWTRVSPAITPQQLETELAEADMAREAYDELADRPVPFVADNPHTPVPYALTPQGEAAAEPDTWTGPVAYILTRGSEVIAAGVIAREPEAGS